MSAWRAATTRWRVKGSSGEERLEIMDLYCSVVKALDLDATSTLFSTGLKQTGEGRGKDKFGTVWSLSEHGEPLPVEGPIKGLDDLGGFDMASKLEPGDFEGVRYVIDKAGKEKAHFVTVQDPFKIAWNLRGSMENLMMDYILNPELVHRLARVATDYDKAAIDLALEAGADIAERKDRRACLAQQAARKEENQYKAAKQPPY